jgi:IS30 family transposase
MSRDTGRFLVWQEGVANMKYHQLTREERYLMSVELSTGASLRAVAVKLGRHASTICRERRRNADTSTGGYRYDKADSYARARLRRCRRGPQFSHQEVAGVHRLLRARWSAEQISGRLRRHGYLRIATSTIYRWVKKDKQRGGRLWETTRRLSRRYRKGYRVNDHRGRMRGKVPLSARPEAVNTRQEFGHWEGDTVMGCDGRHCVLTLVERKTRLVRIIKLSARQVSEVNKALARELGARGKLTIRSVTLDNGTEFHGFAQLHQQFRTAFYFAQPYHSWERGTNENTNGLIRQYLPKGTCFKALTQRDCNVIERELNNRPRKILEFRTPAEAYIEECCA